MRIEHFITFPFGDRFQIQGFIPYSDFVITGKRSTAQYERSIDITGGRFKECIGESLADTVARTVPYFEQQILPRMQNGERVLIAAHGNSLRALILFLEKMTPEQIMKVNLPTGVPLVYRFDETLVLKEKTYIGDPELIKKKIEKVAGQGKIQAGT